MLDRQEHYITLCNTTLSIRLTVPQDALCNGIRHQSEKDALQFLFEENKEVV